MIADHEEFAVSVGGLRDGVQLPETWQSSFLLFLAEEMPKWRDSPHRPLETAENNLTSQLCAHMNGAARLSQGWDFLQFRVEEPDEVVGGRAIDLVTAPSGTLVWIEGREYSEYAPLIPIECKRLPTPKGPTRDEREYLYSKHSSSGGVQRFKAGLHGAAHNSAAMIAYVQTSDIPHWIGQVNDWISRLIRDGIPGWSDADGLLLEAHNESRKLARLISQHSRKTPLGDIRLTHLWIEMG